VKSTTVHGLTATATWRECSHAISCWRTVLVHRRDRFLVLSVLLPHAQAERTYTDIRSWTVMPRGGHFAAMEQPAALVDDIRAFFRPLRQ